MSDSEISDTEGAGIYMSQPNNILDRTPQQPLPRRQPVHLAERVLLRQTNLNTPEVPQQQFHDHREMIAELQEWAESLGFAVVTRSSNGVSKPTGCAFVTIGCKKGREPRVEPLLAQHPDARRSAAYTHCTGCPFTIQARREDGLWACFVATAAHNHPPLPASSFPEHRRPIEAARLEIEQLAALGQRPLDILQRMKMRPEGRRYTLRTVVNVTHAWRRRTRSVNDAETLLRSVSTAASRGDIMKVFVGENGEVLGFFYSTDQARILSRRFSTVFALDCTYKTSLYKYPLLEIAGTTATGFVFVSAIVLMVNESADWYERALRTWLEFMGDGFVDGVGVLITDKDKGLRAALPRVFDADRVAFLLCIWHIRQNIAIHRGGLEQDLWDKFMEAWNLAADAYTLEQLRTAVAALETTYSSRPGFNGLYRYARRRLDRDGHLFIAAYTKKWPTLGVRSTSRVEGAHRCLKGRLRTATGDLVHLVTIMRERFDQIWITAVDNMSRELSRGGGGLPLSFSELFGFVARRALHLLHAQYRLARAEFDRADASRETACSGGFTATYNLPCKHWMLAQMRAARAADIERHFVPLSLIGAHWLLDDEGTLCKYGDIHFTREQLPQHGSRTRAENGDETVHFNSLRPPFVIRSRGVNYTSSQLDVVYGDGNEPDRTVRLPARGRGAQGGTQDGRPSRRMPTAAERAATARAVAAEEQDGSRGSTATQASASEPPVRRDKNGHVLRYCDYCGKHVNHRYVCRRAPREPWRPPATSSASNLIGAAFRPAPAAPAAAVAATAASAIAASAIAAPLPPPAPSATVPPASAMAAPYSRYHPYPLPYPPYPQYPPLPHWAAQAPPMAFVVHPMGWGAPR